MDLVVLDGIGGIGVERGRVRGSQLSGMEAEI